MIPIGDDHRFKLFGNCNISRTLQELAMSDVDAIKGADADYAHLAASPLITRTGLI